MPGTPSISLTNANNSFSEINWTYANFTTADELDLIVINSINGKIQKIPLNNSLTYLNLDKLIDLTNENTVFIETVLTNISYSSNSLLIPKRLTTPTILNSGNDLVVAYDERVKFAVNSIDSNATKLNIVLYDAILFQLNEFINIDLPTSSLDSTSKITTTNLGTNTEPVTIKIEKDETKYTVIMDKLFSNSIYQIAVYTSVTVGGVENESEVSNTIQYVEPNLSPQIPTLKSLEFNVSTPNDYMVEFITPANSSSYTTTSIVLRVSTSNTFTNYIDVLIDYTSISSTGILPSNTTYKCPVNLSTVITPGITYYYKLIVISNVNDSETGNTNSKTNVLSIKACNTPAINNGTVFEVIFQSNSFDVETNQSTSVVYAGSGTTSYSIKINNTDIYDNVTALKTINATPGTNYTVSHYATVSGIINKVNVLTMPVLSSGVGASASFTSGTQSTSTVNYTNLQIGIMDQFTFFNKSLAPVTNIKASNLGSNSLPLQNSIKLEWVSGLNPGANGITYELIYSTDSTFNNPTTVSSLSNVPYFLTTTSNDIKYYFKIKTQYNQATTSYTYMKSSNSTQPNTREDLESTPLTLLDSEDNIIGVSSFELIPAPSSLSLEATKARINTSWSPVNNPLVNSAKPSTTTEALAATITYTTQATSRSYNNTQTISTTNFSFGNSLVDGDLHTINVKTNLNNIYTFYQSGMKFATTTPITISSGNISGTATPLDGPDIISLDYNTTTNVLHIGLLLNGTPKSDITITVFGIVTTPPTPYSRSLLLSSSDFNNVSDIYSLSLTSAIGTNVLTQYAVIASADTGISIATKGFDDNIMTQADTYKKITSVY